MSPTSLCVCMYMCIMYCLHTQKFTYTQQADAHMHVHTYAYRQIHAHVHTQRGTCAHTHRLTLHPYNTDTTRFRLSETYNEGTRLTPQQHFMSFSLVQETQYQTVWVWLTYKALQPMVAYLAFHSLRRHVLMSSLVL